MFNINAQSFKIRSKNKGYLDEGFEKSILSYFCEIESTLNKNKLHRRKYYLL